MIPSADGKTYTCPGCSMPYASKRHLRSHYENHSDLQHSGRICVPSPMNLLSASDFADYKQHITEERKAALKRRYVSCHSLVSRVLPSTVRLHMKDDSILNRREGEESDSTVHATNQKQPSAAWQESSDTQMPEDEDAAAACSDVPSHILHHPNPFTNRASSSESTSGTLDAVPGADQQGPEWSWLHGPQECAGSASAKSSAAGAATSSFNAVNTVLAPAEGETASVTGATSALVAAESNLRKSTSAIRPNAPPEPCQYSVIVKGFELGFLSTEQLQHARRTNPLTGLEGLLLVSKIKRQVGKRWHSDKNTGPENDMYKSFNSRADQLSKAGSGKAAESWDEYCAALKEEARAAALYLQYKFGPKR
ncbi:hypothetical protein ABBQ32_003148 [Trebouxia sp. C0010 RCD-2024]